MRLKFLFATIASHLVAPLPAHAIDALLATLFWLAARTLFGWFVATPRPLARVFGVLKVQARVLAHVYGSTISGSRRFAPVRRLVA